MTFADLVALHLRLDGVVVDQQTLAARYDALCAEGTALACKWRAWDQWGRAKADDLLRLSEAACAVGDPDACLVHGVALAPRDPAGAVARLRPACDGGSGRACLELSRLVEVGVGNDDPDPDGARALAARACTLGAAALACMPAPAPAEGCAAGVLSACEAWVAEGGVRALERLCHGGRRCDALAVARAEGEPGVLVIDRPVARATWVEGGVLLGWDAPAFVDHAWLPLSGLDHVELHVASGRAEHFVLVPAEGDPISLPDAGCDAVIAGAEVVARSGRLVRALGADLAPTDSACLDALAPETPYRTGRLLVDSSSGDVSAATALQKKLAEQADGMWRCAEVLPNSAHLGAWAASIVHKRTGPAAKLAPAASSGDAAYDACLAAWLGAADLGETPYTAKHTVRVELSW